MERRDKDEVNVKFYNLIVTYEGLKFLREEVYQYGVYIHRLWLLIISQFNLKNQSTV